ncbi:Hypothetical protein A7982_09683 [Minicystis rosea]|nr:Hypothetical protein A7982_09683 [Minicystis rosea]
MKQAAEVAMAMDERTSSCPSVNELVSARHLARERVSDPWGSLYVVHCVGDDLRVISMGADRIAGTDDDLRDDFGPNEIEQMKRLYALRARAEARQSP